MSNIEAPTNQAAASPLASDASTSNTASGIPFIKSRGRTVPKPFNLSSSKKRDISQVSNSSEGKKTSVDQSSKKLKPTLPKTNSGVPFIKKKDATVCEPPKFLTSKREVKKQPTIQKKPEKTTFTIEEDFVENVMREIYSQNFKKDVSADIEKVKVSVDLLITRLNSKLEECKNIYLFNVQSVDLSILKNFCRQHSKKFEIAQDKEKNQKVVRLKKPSVLKTVNTIINKPLKSVLISSVKASNTPIQEIELVTLQEAPELCEEQQTEVIPQEIEQTEEPVAQVEQETNVEEVNMTESVASPKDDEETTTKIISSTEEIVDTVTVSEEIAVVSEESTN